MSNPYDKPVVNLVMFNPNKFGGTVTYTAHLYHALKGAGANPMIYQLGARSGVGQAQPFGWNALYKVASFEAISKLKGTTLVTACIGKEYARPTLKLLDQGAYLTIHDPNDLKNFTDLSFTKSNRIIIIRPNNVAICPNSTFIPHPFVRCYSSFQFSHPRPRHAVTLSRLGAIKRTKWILEANRLLPENKKVWLRGHDDRFFTYNTFVKDGKYPEFKQDSELHESEKHGFANHFGTAQKIAAQATYLVDLTEIQGDGGGTQYTFLEAIDAGCVLVLNKAWTDRPNSLWGDGHNCLTVGNVSELVSRLKARRHPSDLEKIALNAYDKLYNHNPVNVGRQYLWTFNLKA